MALSWSASTTAGSLNMSAEQQAKQVAQVSGQHARSVQFLPREPSTTLPDFEFPRRWCTRTRGSSPLRPRPGNLDANPLVNLTGLEHAIAIGGVTALVVIILVTLLVVWLVRRSHTPEGREAPRRPRPSAAIPPHRATHPTGLPPPPGYPGPATSWPAKPARKHPDAQRTRQNGLRDALRGSEPRHCGVHRRRLCREPRPGGWAWRSSAEEYRAATRKRTTKSAHGGHCRSPKRSPPSAAHCMS